MSDLSNFSTALKNWRIKKNLTQQEVGDRMGINRSVISFLENGVQAPGMNHLILLKEKWGLDLFHTVTDSDNPPQADHAPYFGPPADMPKDVMAIMEMMNTNREVRKDLSIAVKLLNEINDELDCLNANAKKVIRQVTDIMIKCQLQL